jgi:hypothetical protein
MSGFKHGANEFRCGGTHDAVPVPVAFIDDCDDCILEAWERQTQGGVNGAQTHDFTRHFMSKDGREVVHVQYINAAY